MPPTAAARPSARTCPTARTASILPFRAESPLSFAEFEGQPRPRRRRRDDDPPAPPPTWTASGGPDGTRHCIQIAFDLTCPRPPRTTSLEAASQLPEWTGRSSSSSATCAALTVLDPRNARPANCRRTCCARRGACATSSRALTGPALAEEPARRPARHRRGGARLCRPENGTSPPAATWRASAASATCAVGAG